MSDKLKDLLFGVVSFSLFVGVVCWIFYASPNAETFPDWTGFNSGEFRVPTSTPGELLEYRPARTLWDWLGLVLVPFVLAVGGLLFTWFENNQNRSIERDRTKENQCIERARARDAVVKDYLDQMTDLLLNYSLRCSVEDAEVRSVARAQTLASLYALDGKRKATIVRFLYEARLIGYIGDGGVVDAVVQLTGSDLSGTDLTNARLQGVNFAKANLIGSDLTNVKLEKADLTDADLIGSNLTLADFTNAELGGVSLLKANLANAKLQGANLRETDLRGVNLKGAWLADADLTDCRGLTTKQLLETISLHGAILPGNIDPVDLGDKWSPPKPKNTPEPQS